MVKRNIRTGNVFFEITRKDPGCFFAMWLEGEVTVSFEDIKRQFYSFVNLYISWISKHNLAP